MRTSVLAMAAGLILAGSLTPARADEKSHRAAAEELLKVSNTEKAMQSAIDQMLALQLKANPQLEPVKDVMRQFLIKHISYAAVKDDLIAIYVAEFTDPELKEITAFYRTPTGKKAVEKLPVMFQKGAELGVKRVQENSAELKRMIEEALRKKGAALEQ
ncbi:MAG: DUF2059 domain-containing protein [Planctomycetia bacterium]|nr:DUF2059 domain-containing protein [Planctomycetia bacterium]